MSFAPRASSLAVLAVAALAPSCRIHVGDGVWFDGKRYPVSRTVEFHPSDADLERFSLESVDGDVTIHGDADENRIVATLHERAHGVGELVFDRGVLRVVGRGDAVIGEVELWLACPLGEISVHTDVGDLRVDGLEVRSSVDLSSSVGDVEVDGLHAPDRIDVDSGTGDVRIANATTAKLSVAMGIGDVELSDLDCDEASVATGTGDVSVARSRIGSLTVSTEIGDVDVDVDTCEIGYSSYDVGLGSLHVD
ncbi:MAG: DUF4097 family beta strand repeat-containing protein [Planctomycetota bacterium]